MKKIIGIFFIIVASTFLFYSCASTKIVNHTIDGYSNYKGSNFAIITVNFNNGLTDSLERQIIKSLSAKKKNCFRSTDIVKLNCNGEGRDKLISCVEDINKKLFLKEISTSFVIDIISDVSAYGMPKDFFIFTDNYYRIIKFNLYLYQTQNSQIVWTGNGMTYADGKANITDKVFISSLSKEISDTLEKCGHL